MASPQMLGPGRKAITDLEDEAGVRLRRARLIQRQRRSPDWLPELQMPKPAGG